MSPTKGPSWPDYLLTALAPIIWGSTYIVASQVLPPGRPFTAALLRAAPAGLLLLLCVRRWPAAGSWGRLLVLSALNIGAFQALLFVAADRLPGGIAAVAGAIQPLLVMVLAWGLDRVHPQRAAVIAAVVGVAGMAALLVSPQTVWEPVGIAAALGGAACMAAGTFLARRWQSDMPLLPFTGWQLLLGGLMLAPLAIALDPPMPALTPIQGLGYAYLCLVGAVMAYPLWFRGVARLTPTAVSSMGLLSPLTAVVLGWGLLDQRMTGLSLVGLIAVLGSVLGVQLLAGPPRPAAHPLSHKQNQPRKDPMSIASLIEKRTSVHRYDPARSLTDGTLHELVRLATRAPSAYNLQNWHFVAVRSADAKQALHAAAFGQRQILEAAATFIICGQLDGYREATERLRPTVDAGALDAAVAARWVEAAHQSHQADAQLRRDEAIRSATLAAMTLMLAAEDMGLATGAMSGFDPSAVAKAFGLSASRLPVLLVTVGYPQSVDRRQKPRRPVEDVLALV